MAERMKSAEANNFERRLTRSAVKNAKKGLKLQVKSKNAKETNRPGSKKKTAKKATKTIKRITFEDSIEESSSDTTRDNDDYNDKDYVPENISSDDDNEEDEESTNGEQSSDNERLITPLALISDTNITGQDVFGFNTPRRKTGSLVQAASEAIHMKMAKTPVSSTKYTKLPDKRKSTEGKRNQDKQLTEEKHIANKKSRALSDPDMASKSSNRPRGRQKMFLQSSNESDEESDIAVNGSDQESDADSELFSATPALKKSIKFDADIPDETRFMVEEYFSAHHDTKCVTSDRTLASLATPLMDQDDVTKHLHRVRATHQEECLNLYQEYNKHFAKWMFQVRHGFNLLLYGLGSKRTLIDQFRSSMLQGYTQLVVNGFFPSMTIKNILNIITEEVLEHDGTYKSVIDQASFIQEAFRKGKGPGELYLIIHNIDGTMLRSKKAQIVLSLLAEIPFVHVIASIDHINAPLVWDQIMCSRFKFLWYDVTTFEPYKEETSYENSLLVQQSGALALSSMNHVMRSLTPNGQGIFLLIVNYQIQEKDNSSYIGYNIYDLYNKCREKFLVNSEQTLRAQLTEFRDHKLVRSKKGADGVEHLIIPLDTATLKHFLEEQQTNK